MQWRAKTHRKGNIMPKNPESINIEQLLAEADELIRQINSEAVKDMKEEHRLQFEKHVFLNVIKKPLNKSRTLHQI
jgi:hypothetical protein